LHGWLELSYSLAESNPGACGGGFSMLIAPDMRGFGRTSAPPIVSAYSILDHVGDMVALVASLQEKQAVIVGTHWGAPVAWPRRCSARCFTAVAGLSVRPPLRGAAGRSIPPEADHQSTAIFSDAGVAEAEFERDVN